MTFVQRCTRVADVDDVDWNIDVFFKIEQKGDVEPRCWVSVIGSDVTVELNLRPIDDCRSNE